MAYIYCADIYCNSCGGEIKRRLLLAEGFRPDESGDDSDDFPGYADDDGESDCPQHCGAGEECLEALVLSDGRKYGKLIGTNLTEEGVKYVLEAVAEAQNETWPQVNERGAWASVALECWRVEFNFIDFPQCCESCGIANTPQNPVRDYEESGESWEHLHSGVFCSRCRSNQIGDI